MKNNNIKILMACLFIAVFATTAKAEEQYYTWKDVTSALSANDDVKKKVEDMLNFEVGYSLTKIDKNAVAPSISSIKAVPSIVRADGKSVFVVFASIYNPDGIENLRVVRADLSQVGRLSSSMMGLSKKVPLSKSDPNKAAGIYILENSVNKGTSFGDKEIKISAANKKGWMTLAKTNISVVK